MRKIGVIHTSAVSIVSLTELFQEIMPQVHVMNIIDDTLLRDVKKAGHITPDIVARMSGYALNLERLGAELILNQCSSVSEAADIIKSLVSIPCIKIDEPMAQKAVDLGENIAVIATVGSTVKPSCGLVETAAKNINKDVHVSPRLIDGALDVLMSPGGKAKHDEMVLKEIEEAAEWADVIVLAQGSMYGMLPLVKHLKKPVLSSPRIAVEYLKDYMKI